MFCGEARRELDELQTRRITSTVSRWFLSMYRRSADLPSHAPEVWQHMVGDFDFLLSGENPLHNPRAAGEYFHLTQSESMSPQDYYERLKGLRATMQGVIDGPRPEETDLTSLDSFLQEYHGVLTGRIDGIRGIGCHL